MPWRPKTHKVDRPQSSSRKEKHRFYTSARWRGIRKRKLARNPECEDGCGRPAVHVDHVDNDVSNNAAENLRALCRSCHGRKTRNVDMLGRTNSPRSIRDEEEE